MERLQARALWQHHLRTRTRTPHPRTAHILEHATLHHDEREDENDEENTNLFEGAVGDARALAEGKESEARAELPLKRTQQVWDWNLDWNLRLSWSLRFASQAEKARSAAGVPCRNARVT